MNSQELKDWNQTHPVGTSVFVTANTIGNEKPFRTHTRSTAYFLTGVPVVVLGGMGNEPVPLARITDSTGQKAGPKFPLQITTFFFDEEQLKATRSAVAALNQENDDLNIEQVETEADGCGWITISAATAQRFYHLGTRMGKWLVEEKGALPS